VGLAGEPLNGLNKNDDRELKVKYIVDGSPAQALASAGLKPGMQITQIEGKNPLDLDIWQVEQELSGASGKSVISVQWKTPQGLKQAPLKLEKMP